MRIVIPGGSGQVGTVRARAFHGGGDDVVVLSRRPTPAPWRTIAWDGVTVGAWARALDGADVVINLAGRSVNCRYFRYPEWRGAAGELVARSQSTFARTRART